VTIAALHDANLALRFADEVALMKNGSIYVIGRPEEVLVPENVKEVFGVNATLVKNPRPFMIVEDVVEGPLVASTINWDELWRLTRLNPLGGFAMSASGTRITRRYDEFLMRRGAHRVAVVKDKA
jgi:ABC-type proline/glycine betaine transport system ATPase subunit